MIKALLFDLDDTLYPEKEFAYSGFKAASHAVAGRLHISESSLYHKLVEIFEKGIRGKVFDVALLEIGVSPLKELISEMVDIYRAHIPEIEVYPDVLTFLPHFRERYKLGLITDGYAEVQRRKVEALGIKYLFDMLLFTDDFSQENWKPSSLPYQLALKKLCISPKEAIYIGDNPYKDFIGAKELGLITVRLRREGAEYEKVRLDSFSEADIESRTLEELNRVLTKLGKDKSKRARPQ